jgi:hypothetical protein
MNSTTQKTLRDLAARLSIFETTSGPETTPLNFAVGAIFAFVKADEFGFQFGTDLGRGLRTWIEARAICENIARGILPTMNNWLAGYFYNDGIIRIAAAFEHLIRLETGKHCHEQLRDLKMLGEKYGFSPESMLSFARVHDELSAIRHRNKDFDGPELTPDKAIQALMHLVDSLEFARDQKKRPNP